MIISSKRWIRESKFDIGDQVYIKNDREQRIVFIIEIIVSLYEIKYRTRCMELVDVFFEFELSKEKRIF